MLEKSFHAGNIAASFGAVETAANITFCDWALTTIGAALSGLALFKGFDLTTKGLTKRMATSMEVALSKQILEQHKPSETDIARGNMDAETVASNLANHAQRSTQDPAHQNEAVIQAF